jgi:DNA ligase-1
MNLSKLYAKDSKGNIKVWFVTVNGPEIIVSFGQDGGKIQTQITTCKPKNVGRANETTAEDQAQHEAQSKWNKQIKRGYCADKDNIASNTLPPLAKKYQDAGHQINWPADVLVKLDGVRCTFFYEGDGKVVFQSRGGEKYPVIQEIASELVDRVFKYFPAYIVDAEIYCHGMYLEDITGAVKKHNDNTKLLKAHVFDIFNPYKPCEAWQQRHSRYLLDLYYDSKPHSRVEFLTALRVPDEESMIELHDEYVEQKYEGVVIRELDGLFEFDKRTSAFQKYKIPVTKEFKLVDVLKDKNGCGIPVCEVEVDGVMKTFKAPLAATHEKRRELLDNKINYVLEWLTVDFEKLSKYGIPTKAIGKAFRELDESGKVMN